MWRPAHPAFADNEHHESDCVHPVREPDVLRLEELEQPIPGEHDVLVRLRATTVTTVDSIFRRGDQLAARLSDRTALRGGSRRCPFCEMSEASSRDTTCSSTVPPARWAPRHCLTTRISWDR